MSSYVNLYILTFYDSLDKYYMVMYIMLTTSVILSAIITNSTKPGSSNDHSAHLVRNIHEHSVAHMHLCSMSRTLEIANRQTEDDNLIEK